GILLSLRIRVFPLQDFKTRQRPIYLSTGNALNVVNISEEPDRESSIDLEFDAAWDEEHGFMAIVVEGRVTHLGDR
ncbi:MAG: DUF6985 domain-containing protein, partial [Gemmataceae bacterium]